MSLLLYSNVINFDRGEAGVDECGRGCLAGPVVAAAVILHPHYLGELINDSKKLKSKDRELLSEEIKQNSDWSIGVSSVEEIDQINILQATMLAMTRAIEGLKNKPAHLLVDGNYFRTKLNIPFQCIVKGDATYTSIAAASIIAKVYRDTLMQELHQVYPQYLWNKNMGYGTVKHRDAVREYGLIEHHRKTFTYK